MKLPQNDDEKIKKEETDAARKNYYPFMNIRNQMEFYPYIIPMPFDPGFNQEIPAVFPSIPSYSFESQDRSMSGTRFAF